MSPLYKLLCNDVKWRWTKQCQEAFENAKKMVASNKVLVHYSTELPVKVTCDASPRGLGAVLTHILPGGEEKPVAFASRALTKAESNYSQLDREALALVFGVKSFHQFVYGRSFILETDHKPLTSIFGSKKGLPQMAASRVQRWAVFLAGYDFQIKHIKGKDNAPADSLSRVLSKFRESIKNDDAEEYSYLNFVNEDIHAVDCEMVRKETANDPIISKIRDFVQSGWPHKIDDAFKAYQIRQLELTVEDGCLMWGHRVVIPVALRDKLLNELHSIHMGIVKMKSLARSYMWWPLMDKQIESIAKSCKLCLENAGNPPRSILHVWDWPEGPNHRVHADFCGPVTTTCIWLLPMHTQSGSISRK